MQAPRRPMTGSQIFGQPRCGAGLPRISLTLMRATAAAIAACFVHAADAETLNLRYGQAYSSAHSIFAQGSMSG